jgi:hypothetical protein
MLERAYRRFTRRLFDDRADGAPIRLTPRITEASLSIAWRQLLSLETALDGILYTHWSEEIPNAGSN